MARHTGKPPRIAWADDFNHHPIQVHWPTADQALVMPSLAEGGTAGERFKREMHNQGKEELAQELLALRGQFKSLFTQIAFVATSDVLEASMSPTMLHQEERLEKKLIDFYKKAGVKDEAIGERIEANRRALHHAAIDLRQYWEEHPGDKPKGKDCGLLN